MTSKHTPGTFVAVKGMEDEPDRCGVVVDGPRQWIVAVIHNGAPGDTMETEGWNAHLFAAAPDLLDACRLALSVMRAHGIVDMSEKFAESELTAAIAKATGEGQ